jgi:hypothetical protein
MAQVPYRSAVLPDEVTVDAGPSAGFGGLGLYVRHHAVRCWYRWTPLVLYLTPVSLA